MSSEISRIDLMGRQLAQPEEDDEAEDETQCADDESEASRLPPPMPWKLTVVQIRQDQFGLTPASATGGRRQAQQ